MKKISIHSHPVDPTRPKTYEYKSRFDGDISHGLECRTVWDEDMAANVPQNYTAEIVHTRDFGDGFCHDSGWYSYQKCIEIPDGVSPGDELWLMENTPSSYDLSAERGNGAYHTQYWFVKPFPDGDYTARVIYHGDHIEVVESLR